MLSDVEVWRPIPGWAHYEVSNIGRVRSVSHETIDGRGIRHTLVGKVKTPRPNAKGHLIVKLSEGATRKSSRRVHQLVLEAFVGPCPAEMQVLHWNDVPSDNRLANLRYGTASENRLDSVRNGRHFQASQTHCHRGHELRHPNLVASALKAGRRDCLACGRARNRVNHMRRRNGVTLDPQPIADRYYAEIMSMPA